MKKKYIVVDEETYNEIKKLAKKLSFKFKTRVKKKDVVDLIIKTLKKDIKKIEEELKLK